MLIRPSALTIAIAAHAVVVVVLVLIPRSSPTPEPETIAIETVTAAVITPPPPVPHVEPVPDQTPPRVVIKRAPRVKARVVRDEPAPGPKSPDPEPAPAPGGPGDDGGGSGSDTGSGAGGNGSGGGGGNGGGGDGDPDLSAKAVPIDTESARTLPYTKEAMRDHVEGDVTLILSIDPGGIVFGTQVHKGIGHGLDEIAATVAKRFRFKPALNRKGFPTIGTVKWRFHFTKPG